MERLGERWLSARVTVERGVVGFGLEYACVHIIILAEISSENLLPIQADFVTERDIGIDTYAVQQWAPVHYIGMVQIPVDVPFPSA